MPECYKELVGITDRLELLYKDMQDVEFTIERGKLWMLQTRNGKRSGAAAVRIAVEMVAEGVIDKTLAVGRVAPEQLDQLLHPMVDPDVAVTVLTQGLPASPGAASGQISFDPDEAERLAEEGQKIILVRHETNPDDFHGMVVSQAILTAHGGMTSHAAVVARGMGKPCIVGAGALEINYAQQICSIVGSTTHLRKGDWITLDGSTGRVIMGKAPTIQPQLSEHFATLMSWSDTVRTMGVRANADTPHDAAVARKLGAEGIGLCRTEHMFFGDERLPIMREMILADSLAARETALEKLLPFQEQDFLGIFRAMDGLPVTIRLLDPPLHEFLPSMEELLNSIADLKFALQRAQNLSDMDDAIRNIWEKENLLRQVHRLREVNPMLGHRGCRLSIVFPEIAAMQARAIFQAACKAQSQNIKVLPEIMIPIVATPEELRMQLEVVRRVANEVFGEQGMQVEYHLGTMIELPRAALLAHKIAEYADFFSFGTNDLTQTTFGLSRDDSARFLPTYIREKIFPEDPFQVLDREGVGELMKIGIERGRSVKPELKIGICGEHGGEPSSVEFCFNAGINYVSCSPFRVPIARLAAAQASLAKNKK
jgi:pyruvate,orthophosphate dikinase